MKIREDVFRTIIECFKQHGAANIDTPVIETTVRISLLPANILMEYLEPIDGKIW